MNFKNYDGRSYILQIYLKEDIDVTEISYDLDKERKSIYVSNKGFYSIYLGRFSKLSINEHPKCLYELVIRKSEMHAFDGKVEGDYSNAAFLDAFNYIDSEVTVNNLLSDSLISLISSNNFSK